MASKLALGTVQLGLRYGINNSAHPKPPTAEEADEIFQTARKNDVKLIDTAFEYGNSEEVCGEHMRSHPYRVVTKTPKFRDGALFKQTGRLLSHGYEESCKNLNVEKCDTLLVHDTENLFQPGGEHLIDALVELKEKGRVNKIGLSIYTREQLEKLKGKMPIDVVQLPLNILDQSLHTSGFLKEIKSQGIEIHVRSVFLQGLLLMKPESLPVGLSGFIQPLNELSEFARSKGKSIKEACYSYVSNIEEVDYLVCGVNTASQLQELAEIGRETSVDLSPPAFQVSDKTLLSPANWAHKINI